MFVPPSGALADDNNFQDDICSYAEGDAAANQDFGTNAGGQIISSILLEEVQTHPLANGYQG